MSRRYKVLLLFFTIALVASSLALAADHKYVGSRKSNKYHYPTCSAAKQIKAEDLVPFKTAKEALDAGYIPCQICKPPIKD